MTRLSAHVIVYGASCPACTQAKAVLDRFGILYEARAITDFSGRHGRVTTMPQIVIDGELLGGLNQLLKLARAGGLERIAQGKDAPWVQIKRRIGRGHQVVLRDALGRAQITRRAASRTEALEIAATLTGKAHADEL
jgi:glutaredoxin